MKLCIVGWYGTETLGDRAILAGLLSLFGDIANDLDVSIGSLYPFFTERTILEDYDFLKRCCETTSLNCSLFPSMDINALKKRITECDILIIGGGPLMDLSEMYMLEFSVMYAKRLGKRALALGVGWGPLNTDEYSACARRIISESTTVFRDAESSTEAERAGCKSCHYAVDPAVFACETFLNHTSCTNRRNDVVCINFRAPTSEYGAAIDERKFVALVKGVTALGMRTLLVPMHSFCIGVDDRYFLNRICERTDHADVSVVNDPPTLEAVMRLYCEATFCIGMRFHSVVLQSCLNGSNLVLDYTNPSSGKIGNFCRSYLDAHDLKTRMRHINNNAFDFSLTDIRQRNYPQERISAARNVYIQAIRSTL